MEEVLRRNPTECHRSCPTGLYSSLKEKESWFSPYTKIESVVELLAKLRACQSRGLVFRGQSNALWTIRSSALRWWQDKRQSTFEITSYYDYLKEALSYPQSPEFSQLNPECRDGASRIWFGGHEKVGFLQHYGYPTPLIDFTYDFKVALFMALRDREKHKDSQCFSVYTMDPEPKQDNEIYDFGNLVANEGIQAQELENICSFDVLGNGWGNFKCILIHKDGKLWHPCIAHERLASQKGLFIYIQNECPLAQELSAYRRWSKLDQMGCDCEPEIESLDTTPLGCIDVPYCLADALWVALKSEGYSEEFLGLSDKKRDLIAQECFEAFVASHTK